MSDSPAHSPALSIVSTLYRSEPYVREFHARMTVAARRVSEDYELVFVDDGSPDGSASLVRTLSQNDPHVVLVSLSRNFGHHPAAMAGIAAARGRRVFIIDVDLEEQPEWITDFARVMDEDGVDVVFGVNQKRQGRFLNRVGGGLFWRGFNLLSDIPVPPNPCTVRLMSRRYVDALTSLPETTIFLAGNYAWLGFEQRAVPVSKSARRRPTTYTPARMIALFVEALTSFSHQPLRLIFACGVLVAAAALGVGLALIVRKLVYPSSVLLGWPSLFVSIWFLGGLNVCFIGIVGLYLSKVFIESKRRPLYVVKSVETGAGPEAC